MTLVKQLKSSKLSLLKLAAASALALGASQAWAAYPNQAINLIVPFSAGGASDMAARALSASLRDTVPQPIVVQNRGGAGGIIGSSYVQTAKPDGYTLLLARVGPQSILPAVQKNLQYKWDDFTIISVFDFNAVVCFVNAESNYKTLQDLLNDLKERPGKLSFSVSGPATVLNLAVQTLLASAKLPDTSAVAIPYRGDGEATLAVLSGDVEFSCNNLASVLNNLKAGRLRALVTTSPERLADLPDVPTAAEAGVKGLGDVSGWNALYGPANLPKEVVDYWQKQLKELENTKEWQDSVKAYGAMPRVQSAEDSHRFVNQQYQFYLDLGNALGIELK